MQCDCDGKVVEEEQGTREQEEDGEFLRVFPCSMILLCIQVLLTWLHWLVTHWQMVVGCVLLLLLLLLLLISWSGGRLTFLAISSAIFLCNSGLLNHFSFGDIKAGISTILSDSWS